MTTSSLTRAGHSNSLAGFICKMKGVDHMISELFPALSVLVYEDFSP